LLAITLRRALSATDLRSIGVAADFKAPPHAHAVVQ
jgi:hypothetical protein